MRLGELLVRAGHATQEQVNQALAQMDQVTQQNAALVEEAAAATLSMQQQADSLVQAVSVFRLRGEAAGAGGDRERRRFRPAVRGRSAPGR